MSNKNNLPELADLTKDRVTAAHTDSLNYLLNQQPPDSWVKTNKYAGNAAYLPIDKVELLLRRLFKEYRIEVLETKILLNAVSCTVRVHYRHTVTGEWLYHDGVGGKEIQTKSGTGPLKGNMSNVSGGAMEKCIPIAKTNAVKNACKNFGKLFGSDLNRKGTIAFTVDEKMRKKKVTDQQLPKLIKAIKDGNLPYDVALSRYDLTDEQEEKLNELEV